MRGYTPQQFFFCIMKRILPFLVFLVPSGYAEQFTFRDGGAFLIRILGGLSLQVVDAVDIVLILAQLILFVAMILILAFLGLSFLWALFMWVNK